MDLIFDLAGILLCILFLANAQLYGASVFIHHTMHEQGVQPRWLGVIIAELVGILTLRQSVNQYANAHGDHHGIETFARPGLDPDATLLQGLGFQQGDTVATSWRKFWKALFNPKLHFKLLLKRLRSNFASKVEWLRSLAAWLIWAIILLCVWQNHLLIDFLILVLAAALLGNIGFLLELFSRHKWLIEVAAPLNRQWELSHARFYGVLPPNQGAGFWQWLVWFGKTLQAVCERLLVSPGDLNWHISHHIGWDRLDFEGQPTWTNPVYAYAGNLADLPANKVYWSTQAAILAWFEALEKAPRKYDK